MMKVFYTALTFLFLCLPYGSSGNRSGPPQKDGQLVVKVTWGDIDNSPATDVYVEAYAYVEKYKSAKSFLLKMTHDGRYETSMPPGEYDIFISESGSFPRCRRIHVPSGDTAYWTVKLEIDDVYNREDR